MSKLADDLCAEVRRQCDQAEHFKGLWMQSSDELEKARKQRDKLLAALSDLVTDLEERAEWGTINPAQKICAAGNGVYQRAVIAIKEARGGK